VLNPIQLTLFTVNSRPSPCCLTPLIRLQHFLISLSDWLIPQWIQAIVWYIVDEGFVQFIESVAVAEILAVEGSILTYFRKLAPNDNTASGIAPEVMDNYVKSCGMSAPVECYIFFEAHVGNVGMAFFFPQYRQFLAAFLLRLGSFYQKQLNRDHSQE